MHKILYDFQIQTDHVISDKITNRLVKFAVLTDYHAKRKESKKSASTWTSLENQKNVEYAGWGKINPGWCA